MASPSLTHFGFVSPPYAGHLDPMRVLAGILVGRGHRVTFLGIPDLSAVLADPRWGFVGLGSTSFPEGALAMLTRHMAAPRGLGLVSVLRDMGRLTRALGRELPAALADQGVDLLVADQLEPAGAMAATALGLPFVSVANALPIDRDPALPPPFTAWPYDASEWGLTRNRWGYQVADLMMGVTSRAIRAQAEALGLPARGRLDDWLSPYAEVSQLPEALDFPRHLPPTFHFCGPFRHDDGAALPADLLGDGRRLVFASLGSLQGGRAHLFAAIADACAARGLHLVIAHGGRLPARDGARFAGAPVVREVVPQRAVLRHTVLAITNGGLNTVLDALAAGVPLVVLPIAFDQGAIAARVERAGAGVAVPYRKVTSRSVGEAIDTVLGGPRFAERAGVFARVIDTAGGAERAASVIEAVARTRRPVTREPAAPPRGGMS